MLKFISILTCLLCFTFHSFSSDLSWEYFDRQTKSFFLKEDYSKALYYAQKGLDYAKEHSSTSHPNYLESIYWLAYINFHLKKYEDAQYFYRKLLHQKIATLGKNHPEVKKTIKNFMVLCYKINQPEKARILQKMLQ